MRRARGIGRWELLLVTDDDAGGSTAVVAEVETRHGAFGVRPIPLART